MSALIFFLGFSRKSQGYNLCSVFISLVSYFFLSINFVHYLYCNQVVIRRSHRETSLSDRLHRGHTIFTYRRRIENHPCRLSEIEMDDARSRVAGSSGESRKCRITYCSSWAAESKGAARSRRIDKRNDGRLQCTSSRARFLSLPLALSRKERGRGERGREPGLRHQRLCRYQIPRTALSCAFTPGDVVALLSDLAFRVGLLNSPGEIVLSFRPRAARCTGRAQKHFIII